MRNETNTIAALRRPTEVSFSFVHYTFFIQIAGTHDSHSIRSGFAGKRFLLGPARPGSPRSSWAFAFASGLRGLAVYVPGPFSLCSGFCSCRRCGWAAEGGRGVRVGSELAWGLGRPEGFLSAVIPVSFWFSCFIALVIAWRLEPCFSWSSFEVLFLMLRNILLQ